MEEAHPALRHAVTIDLVTGKARHTDYGDNPHSQSCIERKSWYRSITRLAITALTRAEEAVGLYEHTATIGLKLNWEELLAKKGVEIAGHTMRASW